MRRKAMTAIPATLPTTLITAVCAWGVSPGGSGSLGGRWVGTGDGWAGIPSASISPGPASPSAAAVNSGEGDVRRDAINLTEVVFEDEVDDDKEVEEESVVVRELLRKSEWDAVPLLKSDGNGAVELKPPDTDNVGKTVDSL